MQIYNTTQGHIRYTTTIETYHSTYTTFEFL